MSTTQKVVVVFGDSTSNNSYNFMAWREMFLMARPDFRATGTVHDVQIGPQSVASAVPSLWLGDDRSYHSATNGIGIDGMATAVAARLAACSPAPTHAIVELGMNNALSGWTAANMLTEMNNLLDNAHGAGGFGSLKILVMQMQNQLYSAPAQTVINTYNAGIPAIVAARSSYCIGGAMPTTLATQHFGDGDGIHPNTWGFRLKADAVIAAVEAGGW